MARHRKTEAAASSATADIPPELFAITKGLTAPDAARILREASAQSLALWVAHGDIVFDRRRISFDKHRHMLALYADETPRQTTIKGAQAGWSSYAILRVSHRMAFDECDLAYYCPTESLLQKFCKTRFDPLVQQIPELRAALHAASDTMSLKRFKNKRGSYNSLYLFHTGGAATKDAVPLNGVAIDEVRLIDPKAVDQIRFRLVAQENPTEFIGSTAGAPGESIEHFYNRGNRQVWLSRCLCEDGGVNLADVFPACVAEMRDGTCHYRCPKCGHRIDDPQIGNWVAQSPDVKGHTSFSIPGLLGPQSAYDPKRVLEMYNDTSDRPEFVRSMLGRPYIDTDATPVDVEVLRSCVNAPGYPAYDGHGLVWGIHLPDGHAAKRRCSLGIDQHGGQIYATVLRRGKNGDNELVHLEIVDSGNPRYFVNDGPVTPYIRARELMHEYDVSCCITDWMPNYNEASQFARDFPGRVFVAYYSESATDAVRWMDKRTPSDAVRKAGPNVNLRWQVQLARYKTIEDTLSQFTHGRIRMPDPDLLTQVILQERRGTFEAENICRSRFWLHMRSIAREKVGLEDETGIFKMRWRNVNVDPHFVHSLNFARVALERGCKQPIFSFMPLDDDASYQQPNASQPFATPIPVLNMSGDRPVGFIVVRGAERDMLATTLRALPGVGEKDVDVFGPCDEMGQMKDGAHCELVRVTGNPSLVREAIYQQGYAQIVNAFGSFGGLS